MEKYHFTFVGKENEEKKLMKLIKKLYREENSSLKLSVMDAIHYAEETEKNKIGAAKIDVECQIMRNEFRITIISNTKMINVEEYQTKMKKLLTNKEFQAKDWEQIERTGIRKEIWEMLEGVEYLCASEDGQEITFCERIPASKKPENHHLKFLIPKFLVKRDGVVE